MGGGPCGALPASPDTRAPVSAPALRTSMCNRCVKYGLGKSTQNHTHNHTKTANRHTGLAAIVISTVRILLHCLAVCPPLLYLLLDLCALRQLWISPKNRRAGRYALGFVPCRARGGGSCGTTGNVCRLADAGKGAGQGWGVTVEARCRSALKLTEVGGCNA